MRMRKEYIGKSGKILVCVNKKNLFFTMREITDVTETHIYFYDKYNNLMGYRWADVIEFRIDA